MEDLASPGVVEGLVAPLPFDHVPRPCLGAQLLDRGLHHLLLLVLGQVPAGVEVDHGFLALLGW